MSQLGHTLFMSSAPVTAPGLLLRLIYVTTTCRMCCSVLFCAWAHTRCVDVEVRPPWFHLGQQAWVMVQCAQDTQWLPQASAWLAYNPLYAVHLAGFGGNKFPDTQW